MKKKICLLVFIFFNIFLFAQNKKLPSRIYGNFLDCIDYINIISENELALIGFDGTELDRFEYMEKHENGIVFLELSKSVELNLLTERWGLIDKWEKKGELNEEDRRKIFFLSATRTKSSYDDEYEYVICGGFKGFTLFDSFEHNFDKPLWILYKNSSSYLKEKNITYSKDNLYSYLWGIPWVENASGSGIGEYVEIEDTAPFERKFDYLLIMNGYFSIDKTYLYKQNNRVKRIKVTGLNSGKEKILDVLDTPHPQTVDISFLETQEPFRVTIMDVYKGTKYDDTCINCMEPYPYKVIPYEDSIGE